MTLRAAFSALSRTAAASSSRLTIGSSRAASSAAATSAAPAAPALPAAAPAAPPARYLDFPPVRPLAPTHGIHVATLHLRSHAALPLTTFSTFALHAARALAIPTSNAAALPATRELYTVPKSPFVHKKAQENFGRRTHRRVIKVFDAGRESVDLWLRYLRRNGVGGVGAKAVVFEWVDYGFARQEVERVEGMMDGDEVGRAAEDLIKALGGEAFQLAEQGEDAAKAGKAGEAKAVAGGGEVQATPAATPKPDPTEPKIQPAGVDTA